MPIDLTTPISGSTHVRCVPTLQAALEQVDLEIWRGTYSPPTFTDDAEEQGRVLKNIRRSTQHYDILVDAIDETDQAALTAYCEQWLIDEGLYPGTYVA